MRDPSDQSDGNHHQKVWEILPWYVNGTLEGHEHDFVARHILSCQSCADEVVRCQSIATAVRSSEEAARTPSPEHLARLMARIDRASASAAPEHWRIRVREWIEKIRLAFQETPSLFRWALAAQTAAIVLLAAAILWQASVAPSYSIGRCWTRVAARSRVKCTFKWFFPTISLSGKSGHRSAALEPRLWQARPRWPSTL